MTDRWLPWLLKDSVLYGGAAALNKALSLITFPILTRTLSVGDYGAMDLFNVVANVLALAIVWGQDSAAVRFLADSDDPQRRRTLVTASLALQAALAVPALLVLLAGAEALAPQLSGHPDAATLLALVALQLPLMVIGNFAQGLLKWTFRRRAFLLLTLGPTVITAAGVWALAQAGVLDLVRLFAFVLGVRLVFGALGVWLCRGWLTTRLAGAPLRAMTAFAGPIGLVCVAGALVPLAERLVVVDLIGESALGIYSVGATFAALCSLPIQAFQTAWGPFSLSVHRRDEAREIFSSVARLTAIALFPLCLLLAAIAQPAITLLASAKYAASWVVVFPLTLALAIQGLGWVLEVGTFFAKRSDLTAWAYGAYLAGAFGAMAVLARPFGIVGVAWALAAGQLAKTVASCVLAERVYPLRWPLRALALSGLATVAAYALCVTAAPGGAFWPFGVSSLGAALALVPLGWFTLFAADERRRLAALLRPAPAA